MFEQTAEHIRIICKWYLDDINRRRTIHVRCVQKRCFGRALNKSGERESSTNEKLVAKWNIGKEGQYEKACWLEVEPSGLVAYIRQSLLKLIIDGEDIKGKKRAQDDLQQKGINKAINERSKTLTTETNGEKLQINLRIWKKLESAWQRVILYNIILLL